MKFSLKALRFVIEAVEHYQKYHGERLKQQGLSEDEVSDLVNDRQYRVDVRIVSPSEACQLWARSPRHIRRLAGRGDFALSGLSLVRRHQAPSR